MLFEDNNFDVNMSLFISDVDFNRNNNLLSPMEGFLRGNMFKDEYKPYKNYTYFKLHPKNDKEKMILEIMALAFALNDLNLYLDLHPDNKEMFNYFKKYAEEKENLVKEYEKKYGPLVLTGDKGQKYNWLDSPWPWENRGGSMYV